MRFLRPDMARWFLVLPIVVACWLMHDRYVRAFRRRAQLAPRFAWLSRRTTGARRAAVLASAVCAVAALAFALVRPQLLFAQRIPEYERQDLVIMLDRSASMRAHDIVPSRFTRATLEIRNFLKKKPEAAGWQVYLQSTGDLGNTWRSVGPLNGNGKEIAARTDGDDPVLRQAEQTDGSQWR